MIQEKQETDKKTNLLIGQENVLNENINFLKNEINNKKQTISSLNEKLNETKEEIKKFEIENKKVIKEANIPTYNLFGQIFKIFLDEDSKDKFYFFSKNVIILSQTYYILSEDKKRIYPPYKFEIEMIKNNKFNDNLLNEIRAYYK